MVVSRFGQAVRRTAASSTAGDECAGGRGAAGPQGLWGEEDAGPRSRATPVARATPGPGPQVADRFELFTNLGPRPVFLLAPGPTPAALLAFIILMTARGGAPWTRRRGRVTMARMLDGRYSRQELFSGVGVEGQARLGAARVLVAGCGGLGTVSASLLGRAGVGFLRIVDRDVVELSNLQRQALFSEADVRLARPKAVAAAERLAEVNHEIEVEPVVADITPANVRALVADVDLVVDGFDNFEGRYLLNDACVERGVPWVYGSCVEAAGMAMLIVPGQTPCLRCMLPERPEPGAAPTCDAVGVLGSATHTTAALQVAAALRWLVTRVAPRPAVRVRVNVWDGRFERLEVVYEPASVRCRCCVERRFEFLDAALPPAVALCGRDAVMLRSEGGARPDLRAVAGRLRLHGEVVLGEHLVRLRTGALELTLFADGRIVVKGTDDVAEARAAAARLLGV